MEHSYTTRALGYLVRAKWTLSATMRRGVRLHPGEQVKGECPIYLTTLVPCGVWGLKIPLDWKGLLLFTERRIALLSHRPFAREDLLLDVPMLTIRDVSLQGHGIFSLRLVIAYQDSFGGLELVRFRVGEVPWGSEVLFLGPALSDIVSFKSSMRNLHGDLHNVWKHDQQPGDPIGKMGATSDDVV